MTIIDLIVILLLVYGAARGYCTGIFSQLSAIAGIVLGSWAAYMFSTEIALWFNVEGQNDVLIFIGVLIAVMIIVMLITKLVDKIVNSLGISFPFRIMGAAFSVVKIILLLSITLNGYLYLTKFFEKTTHDNIQQSMSYKPLIAVSNLIFPYFEKIMGQVSSDDKLNIENKIQDNIDKVEKEVEKLLQKKIEKEVAKETEEASSDFATKA